MATHSSILSWRNPGPGRLWSISSHRVRHNLRDLAHMHRKREMRTGMEGRVAHKRLTHYQSDIRDEAHAADAELGDHQL